MAQQYTVLARKWRPQQFDEVVGQEHVTQTLVNAIKKNRISHAYLFVGPRGIGKTSTARIFAKALNCAKGPTVTPCDKCDSCKEIAEGRSLDVLEFDAASNTQVDKIREIILDTVQYAPTKGKYKIYLVDEVHMLSSGSFNALLKTLEEPPSHVIFFFATTDPQKVPPTILSRCQRFDLRRIPSAAMHRHLKHIAKAEKVSVDDKALLAIVRGAEGGLRDAESALDQLIAFCGNEITEDDVLGVFGLVSHDRIIQLADAVIDGNPQNALQIVHQLVEAGKDLQRLHADLLAHFRNLLILTVAPGAQMLDMSDVELETLKKQAERVDADTALRIMDTLVNAESRLRYALSKQVLLEIALLQAIHARNAVTVDSLLKRLNELKSKLGGGGSNASFLPNASGQSSPQPTMPVRDPASHSPPVYETDSPHTSKNAPAISPDISQIWTALLEHASNAKPFLYDFLKLAEPVSLEGGLLTIAFAADASSHREFVDRPDNILFLKGTLKQLLRTEINVHFITSTGDLATAPASLPNPTPSLPRIKSKVTATPEPANNKPAPLSKQRVDQLRKDPLIQKALEIFRGSIVDARG